MKFWRFENHIISLFLFVQPRIIQKIFSKLFYLIRILGECYHTCEPTCHMLRTRLRLRIQRVPLLLTTTSDCILNFQDLVYRTIFKRPAPDEGFSDSECGSDDDITAIDLATPKHHLCPRASSLPLSKTKTPLNPPTESPMSSPSHGSGSQEIGFRSTKHTEFKAKVAFWAYGTSIRCMATFS